MSCLCANFTSSEEVVKVQNAADIVLPVKERKCQDIIFLLIFIAFIIGLIAGITVAVCHGDIDRIINGLDSFGNVCGKNNTHVIEGIREENQAKDYTNKKYLSVGETIGAKQTSDCIEKCDKNRDLQFFNRCIPKQFGKDKDKTSNILSVTGQKTSFIKQAAGDIQFSWKEILYLCAGATVLTVLIIILLRYAAKVVIYACMIIMLFVSTAVICYIWYKYYMVTQQKKSEPVVGTDRLHRLRRARERNWLVGGVISTILWFFFLLMLWIMRKRISLVIALFEESGKALIAIPCLMFQPIWTFLCLVLILCSWVYSIMWIQSSGYFEVVDDNIRPRAYLVQGTDTQFIKWYFVFGLLWLTWFCFGCQNIVIAGAVVKWFFTRDKSKLGSPILEAIRVTIRYHLGSVAVASFIIALIRFIRLILQFMERNLANSRNPQAACLFAIIQCCVKCFESCIKYITRNAYIEIAIYGYGFCAAAKKAFQVITSNAMSVTAINSIGDFTLFLCKSSVVVIVAAVGVGILGDKDGLANKSIPIVMACFFSYLIADCFLSVYEMCIDTTFVCFCEDCELNDGIERPYFMSASLMRFVENTNANMNQVGAIKPQPAA